MVHQCHKHDYTRLLYSTNLTAQSVYCVAISIPFILTKMLPVREEHIT